MKTLKNSILALVLLVTANVFAQNQEVVFQTTDLSPASESTKYLLADDVALRDCPTTFCQKITTIAIGTKVRLLEKSEINETIDNVTSRWYKVKLGPDTGWIWGGLIAQETLASNVDTGVKFVFGEQSFDTSFSFENEKRYQVRAIKNGVEVDKIVLTGHEFDVLNAKNVARKDIETGADVISLSEGSEDSCGCELTEVYVTFFWMIDLISTATKNGCSTFHWYK